MKHSYPHSPAIRFPFFLASGLGLLLNVSQPMLAQEKSSIPNAIDRNDPETVEDLDPKNEENAPRMQWELEPDRWSEMAYGLLGGTRETFEQALRRRVRLTLNRIEQLCGISDELRQKVTATAELEFQRLDADITAFVAEAPRRPTQEQYQSSYQKLWKICEPFVQTSNHDSSQNADRPKSLWRKVLSSNLSEDQREIVDDDQRQRFAFADRVQRLETLLQVSRVLGLRTDQLQELEAVADANPSAWTSLESVWLTLAAMPENLQSEYFNEPQRIRLARPLEYSNDLRPVMVGGFDP